MDRSEFQLLLLGAILLFIYIDMRFSRLEAQVFRNTEHFTPVLPRSSYVNHVNHVRGDIYQQYVPTKEEQLAVMKPQEGSTWMNSFNKPLWDDKVDESKFSMDQVRPYGSDNDYFAPPV